MEEEKFDSSEEKRSTKGRFMRTVKAVLFQVKLRRRNQEKRIGSDSMRRSSSNFRLRKQNHDNNEPKPDLPESTSSRSTTPSILSSSSSSSSSSRLSFQSSEPKTSVSSTPNPQTPRHQKKSSFQKQRSFKEQASVEKQSSLKEEVRRQKSGASITIVLVLILMSLGLTVLRGKMWAIAFNAMWLACVSQKWSSRLRRSEFRSGDEVEEMVVKESAMEVRRRVIMEGLLDRRHHHQQQPQQQQQQL